ncbi:MAG: protein-export membrane protein SecF [Patescibacteria group bacterium]|nr:MAG: protein-export membrane protein SecF [Patescibacteria group bacterium]
MNIMRFRTVYFAISLLVLIPCIFSLLFFGFKPSIDFVGGSLLEITAKQDVSKEKIQEIISGVYQVQQVQETEENRFVVEGVDIANETKVIALGKLTENIGEVQELRFESVGPTLSKELLLKTLTALLLVASIITMYVWRQFSELKYGVSAILAMFHDSLVLLGSFSLLGHFFGVQVDVLFVTALLTTLSFSVHDTIVVYDRIRELKRKHGGTDFKMVVNMAVVETLSRSINNSVTIIVMLAALSLLGGTTIRWFAVALLIGAITGTYSSTFTAAPLLLLWDDIVAKKKSKK